MRLARTAETPTPHSRSDVSTTRRSRQSRGLARYYPDMRWPLTPGIINTNVTRNALSHRLSRSDSFRQGRQGESNVVLEGRFGSAFAFSFVRILSSELCRLNFNSDSHAAPGVTPGAARATQRQASSRCRRAGARGHLRRSRVTLRSWVSPSSPRVRCRKACVELYLLQLTLVCDVWTRLRSPRLCLR